MNPPNIYVSLILEWKEKFKHKLNELIELKEKTDAEYVRYNNLLVGQANYLINITENKWKIHEKDLIKKAMAKISDKNFELDLYDIDENNKALAQLYSEKLEQEELMKVPRAGIDYSVAEDVYNAIQLKISLYESRNKKIKTDILIKKQNMAIIKVNQDLIDDKHDLLVVQQYDNSASYKKYKKFEEDMEKFNSSLQIVQSIIININDSFDTRLNLIYKSITNKLTELTELQKELQIYENMYPKQGTDEYALRLFLKFNDLVRINKPPVLTKFTTKIENNCNNRSIKPKIFQTMLSNLMDPTVGKGNGLLVYHDVGTGKTCTSLIFIQSYYLNLVAEYDNDIIASTNYALNNKSVMPASATNATASKRQRMKELPTALILLPTPELMNNFKHDLEKGCLLENLPKLFMSDLFVERTMAKNVTTSEWNLLHPTTKVEILRVVLHIMQHDLDKRYHDMWSTDKMAQDTKTNAAGKGNDKNVGVGIGGSRMYGGADGSGDNVESALPIADPNTNQNNKVNASGNMSGNASGNASVTKPIHKYEQKTNDGNKNQKSQNENKQKKPSSPSNKRSTSPSNKKPSSPSNKKPSSPSNKKPSSPSNKKAVQAPAPVQAPVPSQAQVPSPEKKSPSKKIDMAAIEKQLIINSQSQIQPQQAPLPPPVPILSPIPVKSREKKSPVKKSPVKKVDITKAEKILSPRLTKKTLISEDNVDTIIQQHKKENDSIIIPVLDNEKMQVDHPHYSESILPKVGIIIVDEAHNILNAEGINTSGQGRRRVLDYAQLLSKTNLPVMLLTATPVIDENSLLDLFLLLDIIRDKKLKPLTDRIYDRSNYDARNTALISKWMKLDNYTRDWEWLPKKEEEFYKTISGYISHMTLRNDPQIYPRIKSIELVTVPQPTRPLHGSYDTFSPNDPKFTLDTDKNNKKWDLLRDRLYNNEKHFIYSPRKHFKKIEHGINYLFAGTHSMLSDLSNYVDLNNKDSIDKKDWITPWFETNTQKLRYIYLGATKSDESLSYIRNRSTAYRLLFNDERNKYGKYIQVVIGTAESKEGINLLDLKNIHILQPPPTRQNMLQILGRALRNCSFEAYSKNPIDWNVKLNVYIASDAEEFMYKSRLDIMSYEYGAIESESKDTPTDLALTALKRGAVDCLLYQNLTNVQSCYSVYSGNSGISAFEKTNGLCTSLIDNTILVVPKDTLNYAEYCSNTLNGVPGGTYLYSDNDAEIYLYLLEHDYQPVALQDIKFLIETNKHIRNKTDWREKDAKIPIIERVRQFYNKLRMKFGPNFLFGLKWNEEDYPYLVMTPLVRPKELIKRIESSPREIGNAIMFLLLHKRNISDPDIIASIDAKIRIKHKIPGKTIEYEKELQEVLDKLRELDNESNDIIKSNVKRMSKIKKISPAKIPSL